MNSCNFTGRIANDLELRTSPSGVSVCSFSLAVKRPRVKDETDFINFTAFRQTAEYLATYAKKGTLIEVSGVLTSRKWQDKNGNNRTSFEVIVDNASILESKNNTQATQQDPLVSFAQNVEKADFEEVNISDMDLPF